MGPQMPYIKYSEQQKLNLNTLVNFQCLKIVHISLYKGCNAGLA